MSEDDEELEEEEDLTPEESTPSNVFTTPDLLTAYRNYHADLRTIIPPHLNVSGLLLTLSFGAMYFIIKDSKNIPVQIPRPIFGLLLGIIILLTVSIFFGILSIYLRPVPTTLERSSLTELAYQSKTYNRSRRCSIAASATLIFAILAIIFALLAFAGQENSIGTFAKAKELRYTD